jgi:hypothetical protein
MEQCYISFRSVTLAQRAEGILKREGYRCYLQRAPKWMGQRGCSYALRVRRTEVGACVAALQQERAVFSKVYCQYTDGRREELIL